jgi:hypothetical protein
MKSLIFWLRRSAKLLQPVSPEDGISTVNPNADLSSEWISAQELNANQWSWSRSARHVVEGQRRCTGACHLPQCE